MKIYVESIKLLSNTFLVCKFNVSKELKKYFKEYEFFVEYNHDISGVPESILSIPILTNLLPIAWFTGSTIYIDSLDKKFSESLDSLKNAFQEMYPNIKMGGGVLPKNIIDNKKESHTESPATLFSGGIDSLDTFVRYRERNPYLVTVWGADINLDWEAGWEKVRVNNSEFAQKYNLQNIFIKSNFRRFLNERNLVHKCAKKKIWSWWGEVQHGMALTGLCAPVSFSLGFNEIYIPSSDFQGNNKRWGSCPQIDNNIKWSESRVIHDGGGLKRQEKISSIAIYMKAYDPNLTVRACWKSSKGDNCGKCEKCCRTMTGFIIEGIEPHKHGFPPLNAELIKLNLNSGKYDLYNNNILNIWSNFKQRLMDNGIPVDSQHKDYLQWLLNRDFKKYQKTAYFYIKLRTLKHRVISFFKH